MARVVTAACADYSDENLSRAIENIISQYGNLFMSLNQKSKIVIKPNLLMAKNAYDFLTLTSPKLLHIFITSLIKYTAPENITIADSPGGSYSANALKRIYEYTGYTAIAEKTGVKLNYDVTSKPLSKVIRGERKTFNIITPIYESDFIINLNRLKTHTLAMMSAGAKNMFGVIPGVEKIEMHSRFPTSEIFAGMIADLCHMRPPAFTLTDAVTVMEGNGPSSGTPRNVGLLLASDDVFALDSINARLLGIDVPSVKCAEEYGYCGKDIEIAGEAIDKYIIKNLKMPDTTGLMSTDNLVRFKGLMDILFNTKPHITKECKKCGACIRNCPQKIIKQINGKIKITERRKCIKCYCCSELCPHDAVEVKKSFILRVMNR